MAVTLANVRAGMQDALSAQVIDEFCKSSYLLDNMIFDDAVTPMGGGASMTYAYTRVTTWPAAGTRAVNTEYTAQEAEKKRYIVDLKVMGGSFEIDDIALLLGLLRRVFGVHRAGPGGGPGRHAGIGVGHRRAAAHRGHRVVEDHVVQQVARLAEFIDHLRA